jgi:hypothetical protein
MSTSFNDDLLFYLFGDCYILHNLGFAIKGPAKSKTDSPYIPQALHFP